MNNPALIKQFFSGSGKADGILKVDKYIAMPGQEITLHIDRSEGAKYVGGYCRILSVPRKTTYVAFRYSR